MKTVPRSGILLGEGARTQGRPTMQVQSAPHRHRVADME